MDVVEQPCFTRRKLRVVAIGAGFSNLTLAYKHNHKGDNSYIDLQIYEKNPEIGGTWV
jgi:cation diffusion facilitator CzcD-associated flavoprotein CzcO